LDSKEICQAFPVANMPTLTEVLRERFDDAPGGAQRLGQLKKTKNIKGFIGEFDRVDYYRVRFAGRSSLTVEVTGLDASGKLRILDQKGNAVAKAKTTGIGKTLDAGTYYIQVRSRSAKGQQYSLKASAKATDPTSGGGTPSKPGTGTVTPISDPTDPGNAPSKALEVGVLNGAKTFRGTVNGVIKTSATDMGFVDLADFYRFTLDKPSELNTTLSIADPTKGSASFSLLYDSNRNGVIDLSQENKPTDETLIKSTTAVNLQLAAGTYYISVIPDIVSNTATGTYELKLETKAITGLSPTIDPNIGLRSASPLGNLNQLGNLNLKQIVGTSFPDTVDVYQFTLTSEASAFTATINANNLSDDVTLSLIYDINGNGVANIGYEAEAGGIVIGDFIGGASLSPSSVTADTVSVTKNLGAGTYYLAVTQKKRVDTSTYDLNLFADTITGLTPDAGNTMGTALNIGTLNRNYSNGFNYKQYVGSPDPSDFYRFTLDQTRNVTGTVLGMSESTGFRVIADLNGDGQIQEEEVYKGEIFTKGKPDVNVRSEDFIYNVLPPYYTGKDPYEPKFNRTVSSTPVSFYANLPAGTYFVEVKREALSDNNLKDGLNRTGGSNLLYDFRIGIDG
jgi:hypothetical protein